MRSHLNIKKFSIKDEDFKDKPKQFVEDKGTTLENKKDKRSSHKSERRM